jgi:hypothetical protein
MQMPVDEYPRALEVQEDLRESLQAGAPMHFSTLGVQFEQNNK